MPERKKQRNTRETKAGMMNKGKTKNKKDITSTKDPENTPKISKENAEVDHGDKPIH